MTAARKLGKHVEWCGVCGQTFADFPIGHEVHKILRGHKPERDYRRPRVYPAEVAA